MTIASTISNKFKDLRFNELKHEYRVNEKELKPVSNIVGEFKEPFDTEGIATKYAKKHGRTKEAVIAQWKGINDEANELGHTTHRFGEDYAYAKYFDSSDLSVFIPVNSHQKAVIKYWDELPHYLMPVSLELKMYSKLFDFAGTCDVLLYNSNTGRFILADYKTNKDIFKNFAGNVMLPPFHYMLDMPYNHYQLQLSLYHMLMEEAGYEIEDRVIIWLLPDGTYKLYSTGDFRKMLKNYFNGECWRSNTESTIIVL